MKQFPKINFTDRAINTIQDNIVEAINPLLALPLSSSNLIENIPIIVGNNSINTGLGRPYRGWIVARMKDGASVLNEVTTNNPSILILASGFTCTVSLIVF